MAVKCFKFGYSAKRRHKMLYIHTYVHTSRNYKEKFTRCRLNSSSKQSAHCALIIVEHFKEAYWIKMIGPGMGWGGV